MLLGKTIQKTKIFFHKTLKNLKSFLFEGYQKLPKAPPPNSFSCSSSNTKMQQLDQFYKEFSEQFDCDDHNNGTKKKKNLMSAKRPIEDEDANKQSSMQCEEHTVVKIKSEDKEGEQRIGSSIEEKRGPCSQSVNRGSHVLPQKMKELEKMEVNDVDHVLDIEEVLHYYSRLTSPVYLDIVDKFFMDVYSEFYLPQPSVSVNSSMRKLGPDKF